MYLLNYPSSKTVPRGCVRHPHAVGTQSRTASTAAAVRCPACTASLQSFAIQQQQHSHNSTQKSFFHLSLPPTARTAHACVKVGSGPLAVARRAVAAAAAAAAGPAAAAAADNAATAPDIDPQVYLDPAVSPAPFVGPIAVKHIPGEPISRSSVHVTMHSCLNCKFQQARMDVTH
jgi:hypothetical protein